MKRLWIFAVIFTFAMGICALNGVKATAMPYYDLNPKKIVLKSKFSTSYKSSSLERKHNIELCVKSINGTLLDVLGEFSFNNTVGKRTEDRGYKRAKIIFDGEFVEGVGGGVCQVSTTLYNAVILAGLKVNEVHQHSLQVSYVLPSFDAMVNSGSADLRFQNNTDNPLLIYAYADGSTLTFEIYGEENEYTIKQKSVVIKELDPPNPIKKLDTEWGIDDLFVGEERVLRYGKGGIISQGYVERYKNGKFIDRTLIRKDVYMGIKGQIAIGTKIREESIEEQIKVYKKPLTNNIFCDNITYAKWFSAVKN